MSFYSLTPTTANLVTVLPQTGAPDIRKFDDSALNAAIDGALKALPEGKKMVGLVRIDMSGGHFTLAGKVDSPIPGELAWTVYADKPWSGNFDAGLGVRWSI